MSVKIVIKRYVPANKAEELSPLLRNLRALATKETAYLSGETLKRIDGRGEYLVISTWQTLGDWERWINNDQRKVIQAKIDMLLGEPTEYAVYQNA
jgi:heme-degrading monooxygenase HmoA